MKRRNIMSCALILMSILLCACSKGDSAISVKEKNLRMNIDEKYTVKVLKKDDDIVNWTSNDESVAVVSPDGTVSAVGNGITTVTARTEKSFVHVGVIVGGDNDYVDKNGNVVQVFDGESDITEISVGVRGGGKDDISVKQGDTHALSAYTTPSDSKDKIVWTTDDSTVARVDEKGNLQAVGKGKTTITAYAPNGVNGKIIVRVK